jgi:ribonucleotide monophosphatase NagD (HAD superfamily)
VHWSNPDLIFKGGFSLPRFGQGALQEATAAVYKAITGHPLYSKTHGKPSLSTYRFAEKMLVDLGSDLSSVCRWFEAILCSSSDASYRYDRRQPS